MRSMFRKITGKPANSFDQVEEMTTRKLPIPDLGDPNKFVQFIAKRTKEGYWTIHYKNNVKSITAGFETIKDAYPVAVKKHSSAAPSSTLTQTYNFDTAFLILRDMEETLLKHSGAVLDTEPDRHYMAAYRLLPRQFQESLDDLFLTRTESKGAIIPPKDAPKVQTAHKDQMPKPPKPN